MAEGDLGDLAGLVVVEVDGLGTDLVEDAEAVGMEGAGFDAAGQPGGEVSDSMFVIGEVDAFLFEGVGSRREGGGLPGSGSGFQEEVIGGVNDRFKEGPLLRCEMVWDAEWSHRAFPLLDAVWPDLGATRRDTSPRERAPPSAT